MFAAFLSQEFDDHRDADDAVYELNGKELMGERWVQLSSIPCVWFQIMFAWIAQ